MSRTGTKKPPVNAAAPSNVCNDLRPLPPRWRWVKFGDVVRNVNEAVRHPVEAGLERYVGLEHMEPEHLRLQQWGNLAGSDVTFTKRFRKGQVLFAKRRTYQRKVAVADFDGVCSSDILTFEPNRSHLISELLPFVIQSDGFFGHALGTSAGSLSPRTRWSQLKDYSFALPPVDEQVRISNLLRAADDSIETWLATSSSANGVIGSVQESVISAGVWPRVQLGECLARIEPGTSVLGINEPADISSKGVLKVSAVGAEGFVPEENKRILTPADFDSQFAVRRGDVLITRSNTPELVGRICVVTEDHPNLMLCDKTLRLHFSTQVASIPFMVEALRTQSSRRQIMAMASGTGGAMKNISQDRLRKVLVPLPPPCEQERVGAMVESLRQSKDAIRSHLWLAVSLKQQLRETLLAVGDRNVQ